MNMRYGCVCFAVPRKLLQHLADKSSGEHRELLHSQIQHSAKLRGQRAEQTWNPPEARRGKQLLHRQVFDALGSVMLPGDLLRDEDDPAVRDKDANAAYENVGIAMQFLKKELGRDSLDGRGLRVDTSVHYKSRFNNAMWTGSQLAVGDGDGVAFKGFAHSLGIIAHEFAHGLSQHLVRGGLGVVKRPGQELTLKGEAGALNESFCDVFASMVKQWDKKQDARDADWLLGEDIFAGHAGKAIRSLKEPGKDSVTWEADDQIRDYKRMRPTDDVHRTSGIPNHAFYVAAARLGGKSWESLGPVWLKGFDRLHARATFLEAAHATVDVAAALHGKGSDAHEAVKAGWKKVNVLA